MPPFTAQVETLPVARRGLARDIAGRLSEGAPFCCRLLAHDPGALAWLTEPTVWRDSRARADMATHLSAHLGNPTNEEEWMRSARRFRAREIARLAALDLSGIAEIPETVTQLSVLADICVEAALVRAREQIAARMGRPALEGGSGIAVIALGKLGAQELNFSSDIDILFVYANDGETQGGPSSATHLEWAVACAQTVTRLLDRQTQDGRLFRVDLRLRPDGESGPLAITPAWASRYYEKRGQPWERVALVRARTCAGDPNVGAQFREAVEPFVFRPEVDDELVSSLRDVKRQITEALAARKRAGFDVKLGRGGIRELEFFIHTLQLLHAGRTPALREHQTYALIDALEREGHIDDNLRRSVAEDYTFLRHIEHRLQMREDQQTHRLPSDEDARGAIAQGLGFASLTRFDDRLERVREGIHLLFASLFADQENAEEAALRDRLAQQLTSHADGLSVEVARATLVYWPIELLRRETPRAIADGFSLLGQVTDDEPVAIRLEETDDGCIDMRLAGQDRTGLASVSTGVLASAGLNIEAGRLFTLPAHQVGGRTLGARAMQYLRVRPASGTIWTDASRRQLSMQLNDLTRRWLLGEVDEVRAELNTLWVESMRLAPPVLAETFRDIDVEFDNRSDPDASIVGLWAADAPGFLYGFTQALAMRGINVHQTRIRTEGGRVLDRFHLTDRHGRKIITRAARHEVEVIAVLIKAFTHFLSRAADPARALTQFDALLDRLEQEGDADIMAALGAEALMASLATVLGSGTHLFEDFLRLKPAHMLPVLHAVSSGYPSATIEIQRDGTLSERRQQLIGVRDAELFRIDCELLTRGDHSLEAIQHPSPPLDGARLWPSELLARGDPAIERFSEQLTRLAERVLEEAWQLALDTVAESYGPPLARDGSPIPWIVCGLGKLGGRELGVASDLELQVIYADEGVTTGPRVSSAGEFFERAVQELRRAMPSRRDGIFELDLRLRPHGSQGPLATSLAGFTSYYSPDGAAAPFERQALIRMVPTFGDAELAERVRAARDRFTYGAQAFPIAEMLALRARQMAELTDPQITHLKWGRGGLADVEYAVQVEQIQHGRKNPILRTPNTLRAIDALAQTRVLDPAEVQTLRRAYGLLRRVINGLRLERGNSRDLTLPDPDSREMGILARRLGIPALVLQEDLALCMEAVQALVEQRFVEP